MEVILISSLVIIGFTFKLSWLLALVLIPYGFVGFIVIDDREVSWLVISVLMMFIGVWILFDACGWFPFWVYYDRLIGLARSIF